MFVPSVWLSVAAVFIAVVALFGLGLMFVRGTNIERNALVGVLTLATATISGVILYFSRNVRDLSDAAVVSLCLFSLTGFVIGRVIDRALGPVQLSKDARNATLGGDLAD